MDATLKHGLIAGTAGTLAHQGLTPLRNAWLGHLPPYAVRTIVSRLGKHVLSRPLRASQARGWGLVMRFTYGPALALAWTRVRAWVPRSLPVPLRGLLLGAGVFAFEVLSLPLVGATRPPRTWTRGDFALLAAQTGLFGLVTEALLSRQSRPLR